MGRGLCGVFEVGGAVLWDVLSCGWCVLGEFGRWGCTMSWSVVVVCTLGYSVL